MGGGRYRPLIQIIKNRYQNKLRQAYRTLATNKFFYGRLNYLSRLERIMKPKVDPIFKVFYKLKLESERKARYTQEFVHKMEKIFSKNQSRNQIHAMSEMH